MNSRMHELQNVDSLPLMFYYEYITKNVVVPDDLDAPNQSCYMNIEETQNMNKVFGNHIRAREYKRKNPEIDNMMAMDLNKRIFSTLNDKEKIPMVFEAISSTFPSFGSVENTSNM